MTNVANGEIIGVPLLKSHDCRVPCDRGHLDALTMAVDARRPPRTMAVRGVALVWGSLTADLQPS